MKLKLNLKPQPTEDELDIEAFERDVYLADYEQRVEEGRLTEKEKKQRKDLYDSIGFGKHVK